MEGMGSNLDLIAISWSTILEWFKFAIQIGLLTIIIYMALLFMKGTRAEPILVGMVITLVSGWFLSQFFGLEVIEWILAKLPALMVFAILIIFQPELRRAFAEIGTNPHRLIGTSKNETDTIDALVEASFSLAAKHIGSLIAIERDIGLRPYSEAGVKISAPISAELLITIFYPNTPLHDGAVIVKDGIVISAACFFPLTQTQLSRTLGTRHRAGIGITEESDAVVIIVSEEDGNVSIATRGRLVRDISKERLRRHLTNYLLKRKSSKGTQSTTIKKVSRLAIVKNLLSFRKIRSGR